MSAHLDFEHKLGIRNTIQKTNFCQFSSKIEVGHNSRDKVNEYLTNFIKQLTFPKTISLRNETF